MTSLDAAVKRLCILPAEREKMHEFRRSTLCVIEENDGVDISEVSEHFNDNDVNISRDVYSILDYNANNTDVTTGDNLIKNISSNKVLDLNELKSTTARLKLSTRRQSTVAWQQVHLNASTYKLLHKSDSEKFIYDKEDTFTEERKHRINEALAWLRSELLQMRIEDETLAGKLLTIRHDIHQLKLQRSCEEHREMLDDVTMEIEDNYTLHEFSDMPLTASVLDTPLRHLGVTRMNLSSRRFSTC